MNLASQSVLEGLNACLDHRGEVSNIRITFNRILPRNLYMSSDLYSWTGYDISGKDGHKIVCMPKSTVSGQWEKGTTEIISKSIFQSMYFVITILVVVTMIIGVCRAIVRGRSPVYHLHDVSNVE